ncbi:MAG: RDD family protein [Acidobacteriota bacterium]
MPVFCPRCSTQNQDWAQSCQKCGTPFTAAPGGYGQQQPPQQQQYQQPYQGYQQPQQQQQQPYMAPAYGAYQKAAAGFGMSAGNYAGIGKRIAAYLLDGVIQLVAALPGMVLTFIGAAASGSDSSGAGVIFVILGYLLLFVGALGVGIYNIYLLGRDGATLGKRWMGIKVLDANNQPLGFGKAFLRELVKGLLANVCFILLLWPAWDAEKQGLQDKIFSTHVYE